MGQHKYDLSLLVTILSNLWVRAARVVSREGLGVQLGLGFDPYKEPCCQRGMREPPIQGKGAVRGEVGGDSPRSLSGSSDVEERGGDSIGSMSWNSRVREELIAKSAVPVRQGGGGR